MARPEDGLVPSALLPVNLSFLIALLLLLLLLANGNPTGERRRRTALVPKAHYANRKLIAGHHATGNIWEYHSRRRWLSAVVGNTFIIRIILY